MSKTATNRPSVKVILSLIGSMILIAGTIVSVGNYYGSSQVAGEYESSIEARVLDNYRSDVKRVFRNYLILTDESRFLDDQFLADTLYVRQQVLELKVPASLTSNHLDIIVSLNLIENGIISQDLGAIIGYIYELRFLLDNI